MLMTNIESIPGRQMVKLHGVVSGSTVRAKHVGGATDFFEMLAKEEGDVSKLGHFLSSHPDNHKRIADLDELAGNSGFSKEIPILLSDGKNK